MCRINRIGAKEDGDIQWCFFVCLHIFVCLFIARHKYKRYYNQESSFEKDMLNKVATNCLKTFTTA